MGLERGKVVSFCYMYRILRLKFRDALNFCDMLLSLLLNHKIMIIRKNYNFKDF